MLVRSNCWLAVRIAFPLLMLKAYQRSSSVQACAPTTPASSPAVTSCTSCSIGQLAFTSMSTSTVPVQGTVLNGAIGTNANGCSTLGLVCAAGLAGTNVAVLEFGASTLANDCLATPMTPCAEQLVCNGNGQWTFSQGGVTTVVTTVTCLLFTNAG